MISFLTTLADQLIYKIQEKKPSLSHYKVGFDNSLHDKPKTITKTDLIVQKITIKQPYPRCLKNCHRYF